MRTAILVENWQRKEGADLVRRLELPGDPARERAQLAGVVLILCFFVAVLMWGCS